MNARMLMALAALPMLVPVADLSGQEVERYVGSRVRLMVRSSLREPDRLAGTLVGRDRDTLWLQKKNGTTMPVSLGLIEKFQVSRGRKRNTGKGALLGLGVGAVSGVITGLVVGEDCRGVNGWCFGRAEVAATLGLTFGAVGAGVGALIGRSITTERWYEVPVRRLRVSVIPHPGDPGLALSASVSF